MWTPLRNQRGQAMVMIGAGMLAFLALTVVAVDLGHLSFTASEVQTSADAAAAAGVMGLFNGFNTGNANGSDPGTTRALGVSQAQSDATSIGENNPVNGIAPDAPAGSSILIEAGNWNTANDPKFTLDDGSVALNAVRATITTSVPNIAAAMWSPTSTVVKQAVATLTSITTAIPQLPFVLGQGTFNQIPPDCGNPETQTLSLGNLAGYDRNYDVGWTTYDTALFSSGAIVAMLPSQCSADGQSGGGDPMPSLTAGNSQFQIRQSEFINGGHDVPIDILSDCLNQGINTFLIPMINSQGAAAATVTSSVEGFGTIHITNIDTSTPTVPVMTVQLVCNATAASTNGGSGTATDFGSGFAALAE